MKEVLTWTWEAVLGDATSSAKQVASLKETNFMKRNKLKAVLASRQAVLLGGSVAVAGLSLLSGAGVANAALGTQPGTLTITPATGPLTTVPTWSTTIGCLSTANASAKLLLVNPDGVTLTAYSANINGAASRLTNE